jgi:hypothetical protein
MTSGLIVVGAERAPISVPVEQSRGRQLATPRWIGPNKRIGTRSPGREESWNRRKEQRVDAESSDPVESPPGRATDRSRQSMPVHLAADRWSLMFRCGIGGAREECPAAFCGGSPAALGLWSDRHKIAREGRPGVYGFAHLPHTRPSPLILRYKNFSFVSVWPQARRTQKPRRPASAAQLYCAGPGLRERPLLPRRRSRLQRWRRGGPGAASAIGRHRPVSDWDRG